MFNGKIHYKWPFSIAMLNYQRVSSYKSMWIQCSPGFGGTILQKNVLAVLHPTLLVEYIISHYTPGYTPHIPPPYPHILVGLTV